MDRRGQRPTAKAGIELKSAALELWLGGYCSD